MPSQCSIFLAVSLLITSCHGFVVSPLRRPLPTISSSLSMSLKPAATPLMDSGKALARSGELLVDVTTSLELYGGALSAVGANIRNAGDCVAQAAASCRFKTGSELVCDELREAGTCLAEATEKMKLAAEEAQVDQDVTLAERIETTVTPIGECYVALEAAGAGIMQRKSLPEIGGCLVTCGENLQLLSVQLGGFAPKVKESAEAGQRMAYAAKKMIEAGNNLAGIQKEKPKGKSWLKA